MIKRPLIFLLLVFSLAACGAETDEFGRVILFEERFEASYSDLWVFTGDVEGLGIIGGKLTGPGTGQVQLCTGEAAWEDYTLSVWADHIGGSVTLYVRFAGWQETYGLYIAEGNANLFTRYDNNPKTILDSIDGIGDDPVMIAFSVQGETISVAIDGDDFYELEDSRLTNGSICIELTGDVSLDDVIVTKP